MGGAWAVLLLMWTELVSIDRALKKTPELRSFVILNYLERDIQKILITAARGAIYVHVDDIIIVHEETNLVILAIAVIARALKRLGFLVTWELPGELTKVVGLEPARRGQVLRPPLRKLGDLDRALQHVENAGEVLPRLLATLLGLYVWYSLLWRPGLSAVSNSTFDFCRKLLHCPVCPLWRSVRRDIALMRSWLPFLFADLALPMLPAVASQDAAGASDRGEGGRTGTFVVGVGFPELCDIEALWAGRNIRGAAVGLSKGPRSQDSPAVGAGVIANIAALRAVHENDCNLGWIPYTASPSGVVCDAEWFRPLGGSWRWNDHIHLGEYRGVPLVLEVLFKAGVHDCEINDLTDNRVTLGSGSKGRSPKPQVNHVARRRAGTEIYTGIRCGLSWTPTYAQPTDEGTREPVPIARGQISLLHPPKFFAFLLAGDIPLPLQACFPPEGKLVLRAWNVSTRIGQARLVGALEGGFVSAVMIAVESLAPKEASPAWRCGVESYDLFAFLDILVRLHPDVTYIVWSRQFGRGQLTNVQRAHLRALLPFSLSVSRLSPLGLSAQVDLLPGPHLRREAASLCQLRAPDHAVESLSPSHFWWRLGRLLRPPPATRRSGNAPGGSQRVRGDDRG